MREFISQDLLLMTNKKNGSVVITGFCSLSSTKYITGVEYTYRNWKRMYENKKKVALYYKFVYMCLKSW